MASCVKQEGEISEGAPSENCNDNKSSHVIPHNPDEFIDIHGSHGNPSLQTISQDNDNTTHTTDKSVTKQCESKSLTEGSEEVANSSNETQGLKLPVQETEGVRTGVTVAHGDSDDEYESAEEGDGEYSDGEESDDFIPTEDLLQGDEPQHPDTTEAREEDDFGQAGESDNEDAETVDPLEARRKMEESLSAEEKQERKTKGQQNKDEGNTKFRSCEYDEAILCYSEALDVCPLEYHKERSIMFANRAACKMKQEFYEDAIADSSQALELHPHYLKAMLRRAELYEKTEKLDEALKDYQKVVELDPSQHGARAACLKLAEQIKDRNEKMKEEMMGKLKDLGNMVLRPFGLSVNNFNMQQDPQTGSYSMQFNQNPGNGS